MTSGDSGEEQQRATFTLGEVLSAVSEVTFLDPNDYDPSDPFPVTRRISAVLSYVTQTPQPLEIHQLPRVADSTGQLLAQQNPLLTEILATQPDPQKGSDQEFREWYEKICDTYDLGQLVELVPIDPTGCTHIEAEAEARMMGAAFIRLDVQQ